MPGHPPGRRHGLRARVSCASLRALLLPQPIRTLSRSWSERPRRKPGAGLHQHRTRASPSVASHPVCPRHHQRAAHRDRRAQPSATRVRPRNHRSTPTTAPHLIPGPPHSRA